VVKVDDLRAAFRSTGDPVAFIADHSNLPGPRGNLELASAVAEEGDEQLFRRLVEWTADRAPADTPEEFLMVCGVVGFGSLLAKGQRDLLPELRVFASDARWRTREAVAMALQRWGRVDMDGLTSEMRSWADGNRLEQRAAVAALCEPVLLRSPGHCGAVLEILDQVTRSIDDATDRRTEEFRVLRKALGYGWSVAVAAAPGMGVPALGVWMSNDDPDVRWVMRENLKKKRLLRIENAPIAKWAASTR
jgi:hypothetical protein